MKINKQIRALYQPIQPTIKRADKKVTYQEFIPNTFLQEYIYCYWQLKTTEKLSSQFNYKVVSDGCIDILFEINTPQESFVAGFCKKYTEFLLNNEFNYVGVRFLPTMFTQIFNIDASDLSNMFQNLDDFVPKTSQFIKDHFHHELTTNEIKNIFDQYFTQLITKVDFNNDNRLYNAVHIILKNQGVLHVVNDIDVGVSPRQLQRLFKFYIGDTPKTFSKVVQFQNILKAKPTTQSLQQNKLFYDIGYYDQSHFIKDFKNFYGVTPSKAFTR
ncbi:AraC family transcriptional regulator [Aquimarina sediminis]|uniref:AraC family transcriptional regulator n=1 Tax=Aquimarina sediminis TaxID=2070536 RepID=UPI0019D4E80E|nr:helix-turn-helix domain-containing protein [Aquimarina sediminis]